MGLCASIPKKEKEKESTNENEATDETEHNDVSPHKLKRPHKLRHKKKSKQLIHLQNETKEKRRASYFTVKHEELKQEVGHDAKFDAEVGRYKVLHILGAGVQGEVRLCEDKHTKKKYAMKIIAFDHQFLIARRRRLGRGVKRGKHGGLVLPRSILKEIAIMKRLQESNHKFKEHLVHYHDVLLDNAKKETFMILEYVDGKPIMEDCGVQSPLHYSKAHNYIRQIVSAVSFLHFQGIIHRDLKPSNILLRSDGVVKVCDFGVSYIQPTNNTTLIGSVGSPLYFAPEIFFLSEYEGKPTDVWALACVMAIMLTGMHPFENSSVSDYSDTEGFEDVIKQRIENVLKSVQWKNSKIQSKKLSLFHKNFEKKCQDQHKNSQLNEEGTVTTRTKEEEGTNTSMKEDKGEEEDYDGVQYVQKLLKGMLDPNPKTRLSIEKLSAHPWIVIEPVSCEPLPPIELSKITLESIQVSDDEINKAVVQINAMFTVASFSTKLLSRARVKSKEVTEEKNPSKLEPKKNGDNESASHKATNDQVTELVTSIKDIKIDSKEMPQAVSEEPSSEEGKYSSADTDTVVLAS
eukprot:g802.t1